MTPPTEMGTLLGYETALCRRCPDCDSLVPITRETGEVFHDAVQCPYCEIQDLEDGTKDLEIELKDLRAEVSLHRRVCGQKNARPPLPGS